EASIEGSERTARLLQAAREQNWAAIFALRAGRRRSGPRSDSHPYAVPPFGRGAGALLWAHLAAAAKRPLANFVAPVAGGVALVLVAAYWLGRHAALAAGGVSAYLLFLLVVSGAPVFRQIFARQSLIRPLPLPAWQVVGADVAPRVAITSLFAWAVGWTVLAVGPPYADVVGTLFLLAAPAWIALLSFISYLVAFWFPNAQDKLQQMLGAMITLAAFGVVAGIAFGVFAVPFFLFHAP